MPKIEELKGGRIPVEIIPTFQPGISDSEVIAQNLRHSEIPQYASSGKLYQYLYPRLVVLRVRTSSRHCNCVGVDSNTLV